MWEKANAGRNDRVERGERKNDRQSIDSGLTVNRKDFPDYITNTETKLAESENQAHNTEHTGSMPNKWGQRGSNPRPTDYESAALTD